VVPLLSGIDLNQPDTYHTAGIRRGTTTLTTSTAPGTTSSVGSKGDSYDNALVESFNGLYKWELIYPKGPWRGLADVEFATLTYVEWFNNRRLHSGITPGPGYTTPANYEADYYRQNVPAEPARTQTPESL